MVVSIVGFRVDDSLTIDNTWHPDKEHRETPNRNKEEEEEKEKEVLREGRCSNASRVLSSTREKCSCGC